MKLLKIMRWIIFAVFIMIVSYFAYVLYVLYNTPLLLAEDYSTIYIEQGDIVDAEIMRNPTEEFHNLTRLDTQTREELAEYMEENNLKLAEGKQEFRIEYKEYTCRQLVKGGKWINALIEGEWINEKKISGFEFEKIKT